MTGLIWEVKTDDGSIHDKVTTYDWYDAQIVFIAAVNSQNFGGYSDWRLPTARELTSVVNRRTYYPPPIDAIYFPNTVSSYYWSSTTLPSLIIGAWSVHFDSGSVSPYDKSYGHRVRAVRGGQCGSFATSTTTTEPPTTTSTSSTTSVPLTTSVTTTSTTTITPAPTTTSSSTTTTSASSCPSESIYGEDSEEAELLRYIRDNILSQTPKGREIIKLYYQWSPVIVQAMEGDEAFKQEVKEIVDGVLELIENSN